MSQQLKDRTKAFGIRVIKMVKEIKGNKVEDIIIRQIVRSATSVGANYRSALRARSKPDFISKSQWLKKKQMKPVTGSK